MNDYFSLATTLKCKMSSATLRSHVSLMVWKFPVGRREQQHTEHIRTLPSVVDSCPFASQLSQVCLSLWLSSDKWVGHFLIYHVYYKGTTEKIRLGDKNTGFNLLWSLTELDGLSSRWFLYLTQQHMGPVSYQIISSMWGPESWVFCVYYDTCSGTKYVNGIGGNGYFSTRSIQCIKRRLSL